MASALGIAISFGSILPDRGSKKRRFKPNEGMNGNKPRARTEISIVTAQTHFARHWARRRHEDGSRSGFDLLCSIATKKSRSKLKPVFTTSVHRVTRPIHVGSN